MKAITVDPELRIARIEPGLTWGEVAGTLQPHGLALTSGDTSSVGVGGLLLGGGIGWMVRKYGLTIDRLRAVELVTADGEFLRASADENAELFWGLRGGGGNFGVATAFEFQDAALAFGKLFMLTRGSRRLRKQQGATKAVRAIAGGMVKLKGGLHEQALLAIGRPISSASEEGMAIWYSLLVEATQPPGGVRQPFPGWQ